MMSSPRRRILLLADHMYRDLAGMAYLKLILERRYGHIVKLAPLMQHEYLDGVFPADVVVLPFLWRPSDVARARSLREQGVAVAVVLAEGHSLFEGGLAQIAGRFTDLSVADLYFVWNEIVRDLMLQHRTLPEDRIALAGVFRFDFYCEPLRRLHMPRSAFCEKYGLDPRRPIVTVASNFGFARLADDPTAIATTQRKYEEEGLAQFPLYADIASVVEREVTTRRLLGEAVVRLAAELPEVTIVVKPHPVEESAWYQELCDANGLKNLVVVRREFIWDVLNASDVHIHRSCTTGCEAWLMDKPTIDFQLNPHETWFAPEMAAGGDVARSADELVDMVSRYIDGGSVREPQRAARRDLIQRWYGAVDGTATERHAARLHELAVSRPPARRRHPRWITTAKVRLRWALGLEHFDSLSDAWRPPRYVDTRDKLVRTADIQEWTDKLHSLGTAWR